jgi:hypothetical protein
MKRQPKRKIEIVAPLHRYGFPCYDRFTRCYRDYCEVRTSEKCPDVCKTLTYNCHRCSLVVCFLDCRRRVFKQETINVKICMNAKCEKLRLDSRGVYSCSLFMHEIRHQKRMPFSRETTIRQRWKAGGWTFRNVT